MAMQVYVCWVLGTSEDFHSVHTTFDACEADIVRWCKAYWHPANGSIPDDEQELIKYTFDSKAAATYDIEGPILVNKGYVPRGPSAIRLADTMLEAAIEEVGLDEEKVKQLLRDTYEQSKDLLDRLASKREEEERLTDEEKKHPDLTDEEKQRRKREFEEEIRAWGRRP